MKDEENWNKHLAMYGENVITRKFRFRLGCNRTPIFYTFLLCIVAGQFLADYFYYKQECWYAQGSAMAAIWLLTVIIFRCGRSRASRTETQLEEERQHRV